MAYYLEATMGDATERAEIRFAEDGMVEVLVGTQSTGQGHETLYVSLTAAQLVIDPAKVPVLQSDSDSIPAAGGTGSARSLYSEGMTIVATAEAIVENGKRMTFDALEVAVADVTFEGGRFGVVGTDRVIHVIELAARQRARGAGEKTVELLDTAAIAAVDIQTFPNGCHIAEVGIDPETGTVDVVDYAVSDEMGRVLNPIVMRDQVQGGVAQGIGQALLEWTAYDPSSGQLLSGSFMDYAMPRATDLPNIDGKFVEVPRRSNPLGVNGAGEAGAVGSPPAVINAVLNALSRALSRRGVTPIDMPATPETVWEALRSSGGFRPAAKAAANTAGAMLHGA